MDKASAPRVSVLMATFNCESTIERAINSVLNQKDIDLELLIKDGGSSDQTASRIEAFLHGITWFCSAPDAGVYDAINQCLHKASGEWIYILGADDYLADDRILKKLIDTSGGADLVAGSIHNINRRHQAIPEFHTSVWSSKLYWRNTIHQQGVIYRSSLFTNFRFQPLYRVLADYDFHLKLYLEKTKTRIVPDVVALCEASGVSKHFSTELYQEELVMKRKRLPLILYAINCVVVPVKYFYKRFTS